MRGQPLTLRGGPDVNSLKLYDSAGIEVPVKLPKSFRLESSNGALYLRVKLPVRLDIRIRPRGEENASYEPVECPLCRREFVPSHGSQVYCSRKCSQDAFRYRKNPGIKPRGQNRSLIA